MIEQNDEAVSNEQDEDSPFDFDWETEEWVLAGHALRDAVELYAAAGDGNRGRAVQDAINALLHRLQNGQLWARSPNWSWTRTFENVHSDLEQYFEPIRLSGGEDMLLGWQFWSQFDQAREWSLREPEDWIENRARADWVAGDFEFFSSIKPSDGTMGRHSTQGEAYGVCFNRSGLPTTQRISTLTAAPRVKKLTDRSPPLPEALLRGWWDNLDTEQRALPQNDLERLCRSSFPHHHIARDRVRALDPGRKPGPKPLSGKATA